MVGDEGWVLKDWIKGTSSYGEHGNSKKDPNFWNLEVESGGVLEHAGWIDPDHRASLDSGFRESGAVSAQMPWDEA